jgi:hypothetical protein
MNQALNILRMLSQQQAANRAGQARKEQTARILRTVTK